jgi:hypothetical protein
MPAPVPLPASARAQAFNVPRLMSSSRDNRWLAICRGANWRGQGNLHSHRPQRATAAVEVPLPSPLSAVKVLYTEEPGALLPGYVRPDRWTVPVQRTSVRLYSTCNAPVGPYDLSELVESVRTKIQGPWLFSGGRFLMAIRDIAVFSRNVPNSAAAALCCWILVLQIPALSPKMAVLLLVFH